MTTFARADTRPLAQWWWTVDRWCLGALLALACLGLLLVLAASPAVANRINIAEFHFVIRQVVFMSIAIAAMIATSMLGPVAVRRTGVILFLGALFGLLLTLTVAPEVNGAHRWLWLGPLTIQPSEFAKPGFIVFCAWMFAEGRKPDGLPGGWISFAALCILLAIFAAQPDFGQAALVTAVWAGMAFIAGAPILPIVGVVSAGAGGLFLAYLFVPHVTSRIDRFLDPSSGDTYQMDTAISAITSGGLFGRGPGEGVLKRVLPDAHTDYIFAVAAEEFGVLACMVLVGIFAFIVLRAFQRVMGERDAFVQLAASGLIGLFGLQAFINMGVNLGLLPSKGMTLPFISYGGSSSLAIGISMGFVLALTRRRAHGRSVLRSAQGA